MHAYTYAFMYVSMHTYTYAYIYIIIYIYVLNIYMHPLQVFLTFGSVPAARSGFEKENSTPIELPSYLPEDLPVEKSAKVSVKRTNGI